MAEVSIIPTVVPSTLKDVEDALVHYRDLAPSVHVDLADGLFAPTLTWMPHTNETLPGTEKLLYEVHLMVNDPLPVGLACIGAGARRVFGHVEMFPRGAAVQHAFDEWKQAGAQEVGLAVLIDTPLQALEPYLAICDEVLLMSIATIGRQGAPFDDRAPGKVKELHDKHPELCIGVDGGISDATIAQLARAGASRFCVGTALAAAENRAATYGRLRFLAESAIQ